MTQTKYWKPTPEVYAQIQKLKAFVHQVANHELATEKDRENAQQVLSRIETIDQSETYPQEWFVYLSITDLAVQSRAVQEGVALRRWSVGFDHNSLSIAAETIHTSDETGHSGDGFSLYGFISFKRMSKGRQVYLDKDVDAFVKDAANYQSYLTETLNEVEVEIYVS